MPIVVGGRMELSGSLWWLFIVDTILIAASGYVINDIFDQKADSINKPDESYLGDNNISIRSAWLYYGALVFIGFSIALYIASTIDKLHLLLIYPMATGLLYLYSMSFKKLPLIGNFIVAVFCAFVPGILLYAEWETILLGKINSIPQVDRFMLVFAAYILFAFLATMVREIVKDIEDIEGDKKAGYMTLPIFIGVSSSRLYVLGFGLLLLMSYGIWTLPYFTNGSYSVFALSAILMFAVTSLLLFKIYTAKEKSDYSKISRWLKLLMIVSLLIFLCNPYLSSLAL